MVKKKKKPATKFDTSFVQDGKIVDMAYETVFASLFTEEDKEILAEKGTENPILEERALWVAYGLFNAIDSAERDRFADVVNPFLEKLDEFIANHGGWEHWD